MTVEEKERLREVGRRVGLSNQGKQKPRESIFLTSLLEIYPEYVEYEGVLEKISWGTLTPKGIRALVRQYPLDVERLLMASHLHILHLEQYMYALGGKKKKSHISPELHAILQPVEEQKERAMKLHAQLLSLQQEKEQSSIIRAEIVVPLLERLYLVLERRIPDTELRQAICMDLEKVAADEE